MIKLFASDLDGTLLNALHEVDGTIRRAVERALAYGAHVVPATGRMRAPGGERGFGDLPIESVCANGSIIRGTGGEVLKTFTVDPAFVEELVRTFPQICFDCCTPQGVLSTGSYEMHQAGFARDGLVKRLVMRGMRARAMSVAAPREEHLFEQPLEKILAHEVCKVNCRVASEELDRELKAFLAEHTDTVVNAPFNPAMFEITDKDCDKGASIAWLGRYYGIEEDEIAVYGDGGNDITMLRRFCHSYATANGSDEAKAAAGEVIGRCEFHAVPKHIERTLRTERERVTIG